MIISTDKNIEWLLEKLYNARRELQASGEENPIMVLLTKDMDDRHKIENVFYGYFAKRYGGEAMGVIPITSSKEVSVLFLQQINTKIMLMDI